MSVQVFLQGQLHGIEECLTSPAGAVTNGSRPEALVLGRSRWISLLSEVLPRALLAELGLARVLLGSSGGGRFLVVLPDESLPKAAEFLTRAAEGIGEMSGATLSLSWASTENLGDWSVVRRRLMEKAERQRYQPASGKGHDFFDPFEPSSPTPGGEDYFTEVLGESLREAKAVGWSPETPAKILVNEGKHTWPLVDSPDAIQLARHVALDEESQGIASPQSLAARAQGRRTWGVLRGDVDNFDLRMRRLTSIEEHVQISLLYKQFFAGELELLCSLPDFWRKVSILYSGGNDFAVFGAWDALVLLAREVQRLFHRFNEENLKDVPGSEGKTISMAVMLAQEPDAPLSKVYLDAGRSLVRAKAAGRDCFHVFGHSVEWRQLAQATELQDNLGRLVRDFGGSPHLLGDLIRFYRRADAAAGTAAEGRALRPWRYHRRLSLVAEDARDREYQRLRSKLVTELIGKSSAQVRLRPGGRVALEWAKLLSES